MKGGLRMPVRPAPIRSEPEVPARPVAAMSYNELNQIDLLPDFREAGISSLAQDVLLVRIHRDDAIALALHILRDAEAGTHRIGGESNDRNSLRIRKQFADWIVHMPLVRDFCNLTPVTSPL